MRVRTILAVLVASGALFGSRAIADIQPETKLKSTLVVREAAAGLDGYTVYRPADLSAFGEGQLPVVVWGNGACRKAHYGYISFLSGIAQGGYIVVAFGGIAETDTAGSTPQPQRLLDALDWLSSDPARKQFNGRAKLDAVASAGTSCGGLEALLAAKDARFKSVLALNTGFFPEGASARMNSDIRDIDAVKAPFLIANGGEDDIAYANSIANYERSPVPAVLVTVDGAGHNGLTYGLLEGDTDMGMLIESIGMSLAWLDFSLKDDKSAGANFLGAHCTLCKREGWQVQSKGF